MDYYIRIIKVITGLLQFLNYVCFLKWPKSVIQLETSLTDLARHTIILFIWQHLVQTKEKILFLIITYAYV
jgi:hypothetical protein